MRPVTPLASERGVKDASGQGRYHNRRFKTIAEELGLDVGQGPPFGWTALKTAGS